jgi:hypothetical protein
LWFSEFDFVVVMEIKVKMDGNFAVYCPDKVKKKLRAPENIERMKRQ